jgi:hypothetical protein
MRYVFISYHHYKYTRSGGFIELAKALKLSGEEVSFIFAGFPLFRRPFTFDNRYSYKWLFKAFRIQKDELGISSGIWLSLGFWRFLNIGIFKFVNKYIILNGWVISPLFLKADVVVVESCYGLMYVDKILSFNPSVKIIYRPSDPIDFWCSNDVIRSSERFVLSRSLAVIVKNEIDFKYYLDLGVTSIFILPNFLSLDITENSGKRSPLLDLEIWTRNVALYVGVMSICWDTVFKLSECFLDWNFVIVMPVRPTNEVLTLLQNSSNVFWFNGVDSDSVGSLIENCGIFLVPYIHGYYEKFKWGLSAKYLMAMYFGRCIFAVNDDPNLSRFGITVCNDVTQLFEKFSALIDNRECDYDCDLLGGTWVDNAQKLISIVNRH